MSKQARYINQQRDSTLLSWYMQILLSSILQYCVRFGILGLASLSIPAYSAATEQPPTNPYLANSLYALGHGGSHQQDSLAVTGPEDTSRALSPDEIQYVHTGPALFGVSTSGEYPNGKRVFWGNGLDRVVKIDYDSHQLLATRLLENSEHYDEARADKSIDYFDNNNDGFFALIEAFQEAQKLRSLASIYTLLDSNNTYFIANKDGFIEAFGDTDRKNPSSDIELKRRFDFPEGINGYSMGINMTYDGWLIIVTEYGYLLAIRPDFSEHRIGRLQHAEGAEEKTTRPTGGGWVRNAPAIDQHGGIYVASQEYLHKVIWTGDGFSLDQADGAWVAAYNNEWGHGTGATPSLMGFGSGNDELVVITDGAKRMNTVVYWRNKVPEGWQALPGQNRRVAGMLPVTMGEQNFSEIQSEQSVVVEGYGALVVNNNPRNAPWYLPKRAKGLLISYLGSNPKHQPFGLQKFEWNTVSNILENAWVNNQVSSPSTVPIVSQHSSNVYLIGARNNQWTLEAIDWKSGKEAFHYIVGGQRYNPFFSGTLLDEDGRVHYGTPWGRVRLNPKKP